MIGNSGVLSFIKCPFGKDCARPYCHFSHERGTPTTRSVPVPAPVTQPPIIVQESQTPPFIKQESTSSHGSLVISQEEPEYDTASGGGYYGYLGSDSHSAQPAQYSQLPSGYSPTTSAPMYAQSSWMSPPRSSQQMQGFGGYGSMQNPFGSVFQVCDL